MLKEMVKVVVTICDALEGHADRGIFGIDVNFPEEVLFLAMPLQLHLVCFR